MAPKRAGKNTSSRYGGEGSASASRRQRNQIRIGGNGEAVLADPNTYSLLQQLQQQWQQEQQPPLNPTNPQPQNTAEVHLSNLAASQNSIINFHAATMQHGSESLWRMRYMEEVERRRKIEAEMQQKERLVAHFQTMFHNEENKSINLERSLELLRQRVAAGEGSSGVGAAREEEVVSSFVVPVRDEFVNMLCINCRSRSATMLWNPCRHVCICVVCDNNITNCPLCNARKSSSKMVTLHFLPHPNP